MKHFTLLVHVFQSRSTLPSPTTSTQPWRRIQTVNMFCPSTPAPELCSKPWQMVSCCGTPPSFFSLQIIAFRVLEFSLISSDNKPCFYPHLCCCSKLINLSVPDTIDERTINKKKLTAFTTQVGFKPHETMSNLKRALFKRYE